VAVLETVCGYLGLLLNLAAVIQNWDRLRNLKKPVSAEGVVQHGESKLGWRKLPWPVLVHVPRTCLKSLGKITNL
jgi:hypothetical protein